MPVINLSYEIRGTAPRTLFDVLSAEEDGEISMSADNFSNAAYDEYIRPVIFPGATSRPH